MRVAVIGAGAIGGYFGAKLARAGHDVVFLARGATLDALRAEGIRVVGEQELHVAPVAAEADAGAVGPVDAVLLAVKTYHLDGVLPGLAPLLRDDTPVVTIQNGVGAADAVVAALGEGHVLPGAARVFTNIDAPAVIRHAGGPGSIGFAEPDGSVSPRVEALRAAFREADVPVEEPADIRVELWEKAIYVVACGVLGALADRPFEVLRTTLRDQLAGLMTEFAAVGRAQGVPLTDDVVDRILAFTDSVPADSTTSMQRDILAGRPHELDGQLGTFVRLGREAGVPTPLSTFAYAVLSTRYPMPADRP